MEFIRDRELEDELLNEMAAEMHDPDRHQPSVSGMIRCITRTYYENETVFEDAPQLSRREKMLFYTGLGLEQVILKGRQVSVAGEKDNIQFHVDHFGTDQHLIEIKSTRISMVHGDEPPKLETTHRYVKQILSYMKALDLAPTSTVHLVMLHITGDYKPPFPDIRAYTVKVTQQEIDDNWTWLQQRAITYLKSVKSGTAPEPFQWNEPWECKECPWLVVCNTRQEVSDSAREL